MKIFPPRFFASGLSVSFACALAGCSAGGGGASAAPGSAGGAGNTLFPGAIGGSTTLGNAGGSGDAPTITPITPVTGGGADGDACKAVVQQAEKQQGRADIIFVLDNSGSMAQMCPRCSRT